MPGEFTPTRTPVADGPGHQPVLSPIRPDRNVEETTGRMSLRLVWLLVLLSTLALELAAADGDQAGMVVLIVAGEVGLAGVLGFIARRIDLWDRSRKTGNSDGSGSRIRVDRGGIKTPLVWILCLATVPFIIEILIRGATDSMWPLELLLLAYFRDGVLALAVFAHRKDCQRVCCSLSTFLTIFASAVSAHVWLHGLVVAFAIVGIWWLMGTYWDSLRGRLVAASETGCSRRWLIVLPLVVLCLLLSLPVTATQTHAWRGFMPSSGGTDRYSEMARSGVGDGTSLVAGTDNISSFAPIEDAPFLTSHEPSLYDLFDDSYSEPVKREKQERSIAISQELGTKSENHQLAESKQAGRQFSTLRQHANAKRRPVGDRDSNALLYVKGRLPLHLKLEVYDRFDGVDWFAEPLPEKNPPLSIETIEAKPWLELPILPSLDLYGRPESHALKIIRLDTNRIPAPTQLLRVHIDKLNQSDFYKWAQPGIICMDREKLPALTVMHVQSRVIDDRLILTSHAHLSGGPAVYRELASEKSSQQIRELAQDWTKDVASGWSQVQTVVKRLRADYIYDREARPATDCEHTVADFLFESRRGPDYQFASAAVLLLRSLGYSTRLVSGFYVDPTGYDARSQHTPVKEHDVHFWAEVSGGNGHWLPIEPTPGYELLRSSPTWIEQVLAGWVAGWRWMVANLVAVMTTVLVLIGMFVLRHRAADRIATVIWQYWPARNERDVVKQTLRLLDCRCRRMGHARPRGVTPTRWLERFAVFHGESERTSAADFIRLADGAVFGPVGTVDRNPRLRSLCSQAVLIWSWERIEQSRSSFRNGRTFRQSRALFVFLHQPVIWVRKIVA